MPGDYSGSYSSHSPGMSSTSAPVIPDPSLLGPADSDSDSDAEEDDRDAAYQDASHEYGSKGGYEEDDGSQNFGDPDDDQNINAENPDDVGGYGGGYED